MTVRGTNLVIRVEEGGETRVDVIDGSIGLIPCPAKSAASSDVSVTQGQSVAVDASCRVSVIGVSENPQREPISNTPVRATAALSPRPRRFRFPRAMCYPPALGQTLYPVAPPAA